MTEAELIEAARGEIAEAVTRVLARYFAKANTGVLIEAITKALVDAASAGVMARKELLRRIAHLQTLTPGEARAVMERDMEEHHSEPYVRRFRELLREQGIEPGGDRDG